MRLLRRSEAQALRGRQGSEWIAVRGRSRLLIAHAEALAKANVTTRFAARWAMVLKDKDAADFVARVAALKAEEAAELARHTADLVAVVTAERRAAAALLRDRHRHERKALSARHQARSGYLIPVGRFAALDSPAALRSRARLVYFQSAGRLATWRRSDQHFAAGLPRLVIRRTGRPRR